MSNTSAHSPSPHSALRVTSFILRSMAAGTDCVGVLWAVLAVCDAAEQRFVPLCRNSRRRGGTSNANSSNDSVSVALTAIDLNFYRNRAHAPIIGPLAARYPTLARSLRTLVMVFNDFDESADLAAFADRATQLRELTFWHCGLSFIKGLEGRCEYLRTLNLCHCPNVTALDGLGHHLRLEELRATNIAITSTQALLRCPALRMVDVRGCNRLTSLSGLEDHDWLEKVFALETPITSVRALLSCPKLALVVLEGCTQLPAGSGGLDFPAGVTVCR